MPLAQYMQHALGHDHTVTNIMLKLADANLSTATKARQQEQQRLQEVTHAHIHTKTHTRARMQACTHPLCMSGETVAYFITCCTLMQHPDYAVPRLCLPIIQFCSNLLGK